MLHENQDNKLLSIMPVLKLETFKIIIHSYFLVNLFVSIYPSRQVPTRIPIYHNFMLDFPHNSMGASIYGMINLVQDAVIKSCRSILFSFYLLTYESFPYKRHFLHLRHLHTYLIVNKTPPQRLDFFVCILGRSENRT